MKRRRKVPEPTAATVLTLSRRRCCVCAALRGDHHEKKGQIAHLDWDPSNNAEDNLAFLCLDHHDEYDSRRSQSKGFTVAEVKGYRAALYAARAAATPPQTELLVRVDASCAFAGMSADVAETILAISVENHGSVSIFVRDIHFEMEGGQVLFFPRDYITKELNSPQELQPGQRRSLHLSLANLFSAGRTPRNFLAVVAVDEINRLFRMTGPKLEGILDALYTNLPKSEGAI